MVRYGPRMKIKQDEKYNYYSNGTIWHKRLDRYCGLSDNGRGYLQVKINKKIYSVHRVIWEKFVGSIPEGLHVDHINHKKYDNRLVNLQLLTNQENCSRRLITKANASGYKGVCFHKQHQKYRASVMYQGKNKHLGYFNTAQEASDAYNNELNSDEKYLHYPRN